MELHAVVVSATDAPGQALGSPGLNSAADEKQIWECTDWYRRQENRQSPSWMPAMKEEGNPCNPLALKLV